MRAVEPDARTPAVMTENGERVEGSCVVLATGAWSHGMEGLAADQQPPVRPVRGQIWNWRLSLRSICSMSCGVRILAWCPNRRTSARRYHD